MFFLALRVLYTVIKHVIIAYDDVNGKGGSTQLTCSLFTNCHNATDADNRGGQSQPNGSVDFIINSDGWCKVIPS